MNDTAANDSWLKRLLLALRGGHHAAIRESLEEVIEESERENPALSAQERMMLGNLLNLGDLRVADVMVPRADIIAVEENASLSELVALFREAEHSRLPVYRETLDDPTGLVHVKDALALLEPQEDGSFRFRDVPLTQIRRVALFVPPSMPALELLLKMQATHTHLALVIDEYGGTDGLVSIEDVLEEIVGDIEDEHDVEAPTVRKGQNDSWVADARTDLEDLRELTGLELTPEDPEEEVDSLGGLVVSLAGRVPQRGEIVRHPSGYEFEVLEADPRRVRRLRIRKAAPPKPEQA